VVVLAGLAVIVGLVVVAAAAVSLAAVLVIAACAESSRGESPRRCGHRRRRMVTLAGSRPARGSETWAALGTGLVVGKEKR